MDSFDEAQKFIVFGDPSLIVGGAFNTKLCGPIHDGNGGPLQNGARHRMTCNSIIPVGKRLTVNPGASILFEDQKKLTANAQHNTDGLIVNGSVDTPVCLLTSSTGQQANVMLHGVKISGQMRMRNGGEIKFNSD